MTPQDTLIPVVLVTGFLGAGKTSLLNRLLPDPALKDSLVIINEFGEIGLDHHLIEQASEDMVLLKSGCLCCTVRGDLIDTLRKLYLQRTKGEIPEFARVIIETTGLADPVPVLQALLVDPLVAARYRLESVVTLVDAVNGVDSISRHDEALRQAAVADRIIITKTDLADDASRAALRARLREINPSARYAEADLRTVDPLWIIGSGLYDPKTKSPDVLAWLNAEGVEAHHDDHHHHDHGHDHPHHHHHHHDDVNRHDDHIRAYSLSFDEAIPLRALELWVNTFTAFKGPDLLRVKGIIRVTDTDKPLVLHIVQHVVHPLLLLPRWPSDDRRTRLVAIVRDIPEETIRESFAAFASAARSEMAQP